MPETKTWTNNKEMIMIKTFGQLLHKVRIDKSMTLQELAEKLPCSKGYLSGIENGNVNAPSDVFMRRVAKMFNVDSTDLILVSYLEKAPEVLRDDFADMLKTAMDSVEKGLVKVGK